MWMLSSLAAAATFSDPGLDARIGDPSRPCRQAEDEEVFFSITGGQVAFHGAGPGAACLAELGPFPVDLEDQRGSATLHARPELQVALIGAVGSTSEEDELAAFFADPNPQPTDEGVVGFVSTPQVLKLSVGFSVEGAQEAGSVDAVLRRYAGQVKTCAEAQLAQESVTLTLRIRDGVTEATTEADTPFATCIATKSSLWRFPQELDEEVLVTWTSVAVD